MPISRLSLDGYSGRRAGSFANKSTVTVGMFDCDIFDWEIFDNTCALQVVPDQPSGGWEKNTGWERNWKNHPWLRAPDRNKKSDQDSLLDGDLPESLENIAQKAVSEVINASIAINAENEREMLLRAMEAREVYIEAYRRAYQEAYIEEVVSKLWIEALRKARNRRAIALLLLH